MTLVNRPLLMGDIDWGDEILTLSGCALSDLAGSGRLGVSSKAKYFSNSLISTVSLNVTLLFILNSLGF